MKLTTHFRVVPRSRTSGGIPVLLYCPHTSSCCGEGKHFMSDAWMYPWSTHWKGVPCSSDLQLCSHWVCWICIWWQFIENWKRWWSMTLKIGPALKGLKHSIAWTSESILWISKNCSSFCYYSFTSFLFCRPILVHAVCSRLFYSSAVCSGCYLCHS